MPVMDRTSMVMVMVRAAKPIRDNDWDGGMTLSAAEKAHNETAANRN
jgi:hypothetical protein